MLYADNRTYVRRSNDIICDAITEIFYSTKHTEKVKAESAESLARLVYVLAESSASSGNESRSSKGSIL
jgi:hypothetical protein